MPEDLDGFEVNENGKVLKTLNGLVTLEKENESTKELACGAVESTCYFAHSNSANGETSEYRKVDGGSMTSHQDAERKDGSTSSMDSALCLERAKVTTTQPKLGARKLNKFYQRQTDLLENFKNDDEIIEDSQRKRKKELSLSIDKDAETGKLMDNLAVVDTVNFRRHSFDEVSEERQHSGMKKAARWLAMVTLFTNISLIMAKAVASYLSGSLCIISSLVDSAVDITSGMVIWVTARAIKKHDPYMYPRGRTKLEPIALIIVSVIMGVASIQMTAQSLESVLRNTVNPHVDFASLCIMVATVIVKFILMMLCKKFDDDASIQVLGQDHRNDCLSNLAALFCAWAASKYWIYLDPIGAILVSLYIAVTWFMTGKEHLTMLSGKSAAPEFINRIVRVCVEHDSRIDYIDTVYVYHCGTRYLVEVHIVMDPSMSLKDAHDISEALQNNIESLPQVERAFVHCDYEFSHRPYHEHKIV